ncbi:Polyamine N-acetyltransferase 1, variant 3 [Trifolium repens]|nr:Polyamine N-acetyltransferase 1, variant 3 [Trifolium repens]
MSSSILVIQIPIAMDSVVTQKMLFKPLNLNFPSIRAGIQKQLNHRVLFHNSIMPLRCSASTPSTSSEDAIVLNVRGMMCEGCASSVKKILETQPQVLSATVNLTSETALVSVSPLLPEEKTSPNWQKELGETLAHHLTTCGFTSALRVAGQEDSD